MSATSPSVLNEVQIRDIRRRGWRGGIITPHRAFARLHFSARDFAGIVASVLAISSAWMLSLLCATARLIPKRSELSVAGLKI